GPRSLRATGLATFLHVRADALRFLDVHEARALRAAPVIRRRSGVRKFELDLRRPPFRLVAAPPRIVATVLLGTRSTSAAAVLRPLGARALVAALNREQPYARAQPGWAAFLRRLAQRPAFTLDRGSHPAQRVAALQALLAGSGDYSLRDTRRNSRNTKRQP